jgi:hypothetical protein
MIEVSVILFKIFFLGFGITVGQDIFAREEFNTATTFRLQAFKMSFYIYIDSMDGFNRRADAVASRKIAEFNKGYLVGKTDAVRETTLIGKA